MKFSDAVAAESTAKSDVETTRAAFTKAQNTASSARSVVLNAVNAKGGKVALPTEEGNIKVYEANVDGTDYTESTISGDFDLDA